MKKHIYWLGIRESEILNTHDLLHGSITIFGSGTGHNFSFDKEYQLRYDYNQDNDLWDDFLSAKANEIISIDPDCLFMAYDNMDAKNFSLNIRNHMVCCNNTELLTLLNNKFQSRSWLKDCAIVPPYAILYGNMISLEDLRKMFPDYDEFVVQEDYSCGGSGTWLYSSKKDILPSFAPRTKYAVSPYFKNSISLNVHIVVYEQEIIVFPASIQLISTHNGKFSYKGADFVAYRELPDSVKNNLRDQVMKIGTQLRLSGYRGICGIDFIVTKDKAYFMEINARFQSSTFLLNRALEKYQNGLSMQRLHLDAFENKACSLEIPDGFQVDESFYHYAYDSAYKHNLQRLMQVASKCPEVSSCINDALDWNMELCEHTYLYKLVFQTNISALTSDFVCRIHQNVSIYSSIGNIETVETYESLFSLKIMLLNQGIRISENAMEFIKQSGGVNYEEFSALDLCIPDQIFINVPYKVKLSELSPFCVEKNSDSLILTYWDEPITIIHLRGTDILASNRTKNGFCYNEISYLCNDRLRIYERLGCHFKNHHIGCRFCDIDDTNEQYSISDVEEILDSYAQYPQIRHYMIGGGSFSPQSDFKEVIRLVNLVHNRTKKPIYLMTLPPAQTEVLQKLKTAGVTEIAMNLEVFDRELARNFMPGKGCIPLDTYGNAFREAVKLWGKTGNVRTIFIVGLESEDSLLEGINYVCSIGVSPILSLFKPIDGTSMAHFLPPSNEEVYDIVKKVSNICDRYNIPLGPTCHYCEDNTLRISPQKNYINIADIL